MFVRVTAKSRAVTHTAAVVQEDSYAPSKADSSWRGGGEIAFIAFNMFFAEYLIDLLLNPHDYQYPHLKREI